MKCEICKTGNAVAIKWIGTISYITCRECTDNDNINEGNVKKYANNPKSK